ncbi:lysine N(6)-hydroxylase/L-ornithine N(5)-oxygenase family protein [Kitasatospora sp. NPDC056138]|uniref:lysine N(6)-hydroxylase/L-ornithine N(5)-oxygenase family protein n=1 Tax=Kitasatospora sp. NPDC056138 TaxID=3345724 RepID=UPI0035DC39C7
MASLTTTRPPDTYDLLAVGFGPSNLALAIATHEYNASVPEQDRLTLGILERKPAFGWHLGMLLEDATMQISFLKDLATLRNPASRFTFLTYLHERDRLVDFINHKILFPSRVEFHDYLEWAAEKFADLVEYQTEAVEVRPVLDGDSVAFFDVVARSAADPGTEIVRRTRNLVVGTGIVPTMPPGVERSDRVWHSSELLDRLPSAVGARRFAVIGAGQSSAEVAAYLHQTVADSQVHAVLTRYGYSPADDSGFVNRVFDPGAVDEFFASPDPVKKKFYDYHANTNYSVVDLELIDELYRRVYAERVRGTTRLHIHGMSRMTGVAAQGDGAVLRVETLIDGLTRDLEVDVVVCATGYRPMDPAAVLGGAAELCKRTASGRFRVERDYRVTTGANVRAGIYLQGGTEHTHGISASLLSTTAVRAGEIVDSVLRTKECARRTETSPGAPRGSADGSR